MDKGAFLSLFHRFPGIVAFAESSNCIAAFHLEENYVSDECIVIFYIAVHKRNSGLTNPLEVLDCIKMTIEGTVVPRNSKVVFMKMSQRASVDEFDLAECTIKHHLPVLPEQSLEELVEACLLVLNDLRESEGKPPLVVGDNTC